jgi:hypothetical protein
MQAFGDSSLAQLVLVVASMAPVASTIETGEGTLVASDHSHHPPSFRCSCFHGSSCYHIATKWTHLVFGDLHHTSPSFGRSGFHVFTVFPKDPGGRVHTGF